MTGRATPYRVRPLTQAEVDLLPDGTMIEVAWSGGNGPHIYVVERGDRRHAEAVVHDGPYRGSSAGILMFCGASPLTEVRRV